MHAFLGEGKKRDKKKRDKLTDERTLASVSKT